MTTLCFKTVDKGNKTLSSFRADFQNDESANRWLEKFLSECSYAGAIIQCEVNTIGIKLNQISFQKSK